MLIRFFKSAQPLALISMMAFGLLLWFFGFWQEAPVLEGKSWMPFYSLLLPIFSWSLIAQRLLLLVLLLAQALVIKNLADNYFPKFRNTLIPSVLYLFLSFSMNDWFFLLPVAFANFIFIFLLRKLLSLYRKDKIITDVFDLGLLVGLMGLFFLPSLLFFILIWISLVIFRPFNWREWLVPVLGLGFPWLMVGTWFFITDGLGDFLQQTLPATLASFETPKSPVYFYYWIALGLFLLPASLEFLREMTAGTVRINKALSILLWAVVLTLASLFIFHRDLNILYFLVFPLSIILGNFFLSLRRFWVAEIMLALLLVFQIYAHFA